MKTFFSSFLGVVFAFAFIFILGLIIVSAMLDTDPRVVSNSYLHIKISGSLSEYRAPDSFEDALGKSTLDMKKIRDNLEKAAVDERINGVIIQPAFVQIGYAKIRELNELIHKFKKSGKNIYAYLGSDMAFTKDYLIASACDSVFMPPTANLFITGLHSELTFYKNFFKKFGVEAEFLQIGKYKNAPDTYTRDTMAPAHRYVLGNLLDHLYANMIRTISENRSLSAEQVEQFINDQTAFTGKDAVKNGLIDGALFFSDVAKKMNTKGKQAVRLSAHDYAGIPASSLKIRNKSRIAVINCIGTIMSGSDSDDPVMGKILGAGTIIKNIERAAASKSVKAIILRIDSPGGSSTASAAIWEAVRRARLKKPVVASVSDYGASGGYYIAMAADTMITSADALVGSIGIFAGKFNFAGVYDKLEINSESISRGKNASLFSVMEPWSEAQKKVIFRMINDFYKDFVQHAADSRALTFEEMEALAQGRVWTGKEAVDNGLFDSRGGFYNAVDAAKKLADVDSSESVRLVYYPRQKSLMNELLSNIEVRLAYSNSFGFSQIGNFLSILEEIQNKPLALLPFRVDWK